MELRGFRLLGLLPRARRDMTETHRMGVQYKASVQNMTNTELQRRIHNVGAQYKIAHPL